MIVIIDYGMGNLKSVANALKKINKEYIISNKEEDIRNADGLILPGVGAFKDAMANIKKLIPVITEKVRGGCPLLGICLGMQMLFERGFEGGETKGLGFLKGDIRLIQPKEKVKIPHMGWNSLVGDKQRDASGKFVYFVHSFYANNIDDKDLVAVTEYGSVNIPAFVVKENVWGTQFHPEKSGEVGLDILRKFGELVR